MVSFQNGEVIGDTQRKDTVRLDACITGMGLGILAHFRYDNHEIFENILQYLENEMLVDGAWNCRHPRIKVSHSSLHTTLSVLEGLHFLRNNYPLYKTRLDILIKPAQEFILIHELFKSHKENCH